MPTRRIPQEAIVDLRRRLDQLPPRSTQRRMLVQEIAQLYGVSEDTLYRVLRELPQPRILRRADYGTPRVMPQTTLERYCEVIAAIKVRTSNRKGRHLSTTEAIRLLEEHGIHTPTGHVQAPVGQLKKTTVNRYLKQWGYDHDRLRRQPPAVRFQAENTNDCWHFDLSPSDLKHVKTPALEEIGARTSVFTLEGIRGHQPHYIKWLLSECIQDKLQPDDLLTEEALAVLAERLTTPLQIEHYLKLAFEEAYKVGQKPVTPAIIEIVLAIGLNDLEPRLIRYGYNTKVLANLLNVRTAEVRSFLHGQLPPGQS